MIAFAALLPASPAAALLFQAVPVLRDTVVTVASTPQGWAFWAETLTSIAVMVIAVAIIVGGIAAIPLGLNALRALRTVNRLASQVRGDVAPLIKHAESLAANADGIVASVRTNVQQLSETVATANVRLDRAAAQAEERINDFNALLRVVQEEAEGLFVDAASAARGARVSAEALRRFATDDTHPEETHRP